ncbi:VanZ family protein [Paenibacillus lycopersici]|uniref:VanZ family protein n=1 Tax=Paenibacillus lycopersici TaxID=2704462 RepID=A0A6C0FXR2_9BACL|nr:VanZ family protein [Paenibacillus lycopersici]QHT61878.1 VanZ family protein [Paenibacillus lycopersici]
MKQTARRSLALLPSVLTMAAIFWLSSRTGDELNTVLPWLQKLFPSMADFNWGHFVAYFALALAYAYGFGRRAERLSAKAAVVLLCLAYGLTDEYHQSFVAGRSPDFEDLLHDGIGAALAMLLLTFPPVIKQWRRLAV